jgi:Tol biopolymer transport system component
VFSPDGKSIAYLTGGDPKDIWYATNNLAIVPVAGGAAKILTTGLDRNISRPQFTPSGEQVVFMLEEGGNVHLARVPAATWSVSSMESVTSTRSTSRRPQTRQYSRVNRSSHQRCTS